MHLHKPALTSAYTTHIQSYAQPSLYILIHISRRENLTVKTKKNLTNGLSYNKKVIDKYKSTSKGESKKTIANHTCERSI